MAKTETTKQLELAIWRSTNKMGTFGCFEVTIGWFGKERVDYMTYDTKGIFRCYEIKVSRQDFRSANHNTFVGHFNYYVMPCELYDQVKDEVPKHIGVFVPSYEYRDCSSAKKAVKQELLVDEQVLKDSLIRSLCRDAGKVVNESDTFLIQRLLRQRDQYKRERDKYRQAYCNLQQQIESEGDEMF